MNQPRIMVVMPVYNAAPFLADAARSILQQSHENLELIAINDGSTDSSGQILADLAKADPRVRTLHQENRGAVATLNRGLDLAGQSSADYVAIMHADDLALPHRLTRQVAFFQTHAAVDICGTWIQTFETRPLGDMPPGNELGGHQSRAWHYPTDPAYIPCFLLFWCCLAHPTVMFRRHVIDSGLRYDPAFDHPCEDYALWARAAQQFILANIPEVLLHYRVHSQQASHRLHAHTADLTRRIRQQQIERRGITPTIEEMDLHQQLSDELPTFAAPTEALADANNSALAFLRSARTWLERLQQANTARPLHAPEPFAKVLAARWAAACLRVSADPATVWHLFWDSPLAAFVDRTVDKNRRIPDPPTSPRIVATATGHP